MQASVHPEGFWEGPGPAPRVPQEVSAQGQGATGFCPRREGGCAHTAHTPLVSNYGRDSWGPRAPAMTWANGSTWPPGQLSRAGTEDVPRGPPRCRRHHGTENTDGHL